VNVQHFPEPKQSGASRTQHLGLAYDIVMLGLIGLNVLGIGLDLFLMTHMASTVASQAGLSGELLHYRQHWHQPFRNMDEWFTAFLLGEIILRWLLAIVQHTYPRWFFFPFVHWYEVLGCIPALRALRLLRAVAIGYRLYRMGCPVMPAAWLRQLRVYYDIVLEEISDRIVINVLNGVEREIRQSQGSHDLIRQLIERHRDELQSATEQLLQINLATQLRVHQPAITAAIGEVTHRALQDVPELRRMLRLMPVVGGLLENQLQVIGQQIAESLSRELVGLMAAPAPEGEQANALIRVIAAEVSRAQLQTPATEYLLESLVYETLDMLRRQVAVQQWKQHFAEDGDADPARSA
jgi:hypothetical protein